jgi:uncharacterized iron-regulated membrane protein
MAVAGPVTRALRWLWPAVRTAHAWTGLAACALLATIAFTGALLVFEEPLLRATVAGADSPPVVDPGRLADAVRAVEREFGAQRIRSLVFGSERFGLHEVALRDGGGAWLDPRSLAVVERWPQHGRLGEWLFALHHELLLDAGGRRAVGIVGLVALALLATGVAYWARFGFRGARAWPRDCSARELDAAHRTWGLAVALPLLVLIVTGALLALPEVARPVLAAATASRAMETPPPRLPTSSVASGRATDWAGVLAAAGARFPDARLRVVVWPQGDAPIAVRMRRPAEWHWNGRTQVWLTPAGAVLEDRDALQATRAVRAQHLLWPLHAARVGGLGWAFGAFAAGLVLTALSVLGAWAYVLRLRRRSGARSRANTTHA